MKLLIIKIITLILFCSTGYSQSGANLVPDPGFEDYVACPDPPNIQQPLNYWTPTQASPDWFDGCLNPVYQQGVPLNAWGNEYPKEGTAYLGLFSILLEPLEGNNSSEKVETKLIEPLLKGRRYCASFYFSLADESGYSCSSLGFLFTQQSMQGIDWLATTYYGQINNTSGNFPVKEGWRKMEGSFIAQGNERFANIGRFGSFQDAEWIHVGANDTDLYFNSSYIYIDSVYIGLCNNSEPEFLLPNIITANNDGINDLYQIQVKNISDYNIYIYNRWGNLIIKKYNTDTIDLSKYTDGVYFLVFEYTDLFGELHIENQTIHLTR